jgi:hypothetical protein
MSVARAFPTRPEARRCGQPVVPTTGCPLRDVGDVDYDDDVR